MRGIFPVLALCVAAPALVSCYPVAKAVTEPAGDPATVAFAPAASAASNDEAPALPRSRPLTDDGLRMPDMLGLPEDREFRASGSPRSAGEPDAVISRPPTDPPARPKSPPAE